MRLRTEGGWIRAGLTVLVAGVLGGGVLAAAGGPNPRHKVTADGVAAASPAAAPQAPADVPKGDPKVGEKVLMGSDAGSVTVSAVEDNVSAGRLFGAGKGFKYIAAEVKGCSGPHEKNILFQPSYFLLRLDDGTMHDHGPGAKKPELVGDTVPAGDCLSGWVTFTVPEGALPTGVVYDGSARTTWTVPIPKGAKATTTTTLRPGATTAPIDGSTTTTTTKNKATTTTVTTARTKTTATTAKPATTTTTTAKPAATTTTTGKSASATTTSTTGPAKAATTTTTGPGVAADPTSPGR